MVDGRPFLWHVQNVYEVTYHITRAVEEHSQTLYDVHVDLILAAAAFRG